MKEEALVGTIESSIFLYLLGDPTNIDSKMVTSIKNTFTPPQRDALFKALYKFDATLK